MSLLDGITGSDVLGLVKDGLAIEKQRQENKADNIAARLIASTQTIAEPTGNNTPDAPAGNFLQNKVAGIPVWGLILAGLGVGAALAVYKSRK